VPNHKGVTKNILSISNRYRGEGAKVALPETEPCLPLFFYTRVFDIGGLAKLKKQQNLALPLFYGKEIKQLQLM
jgi:hypothetical protein